MRRPLYMLAVLGLASTIAQVSMVAAQNLDPERALTVDLKPKDTNPPSPQMGDWLKFRTVITNKGASPIEGIIGWISLVQIDKGKEQPIDLEDWSAHKAVTVARLEPGKSIETEWPMRLIQAGRYRIVVSVVTRDGSGLTPSPFADFSVRLRPVVESQRVIPVALGIPLLIGGLWFWRRRRSRIAATKPRD